MSKTQRTRKPRQNRSSRRKSKPASSGFDISITGPKPEVPTIGDLAGSTPEVTRIKRVVRWPADWWQAFKDRFFPMWVLVHFPLRYEEYFHWEVVPVEKSEPKVESGFTASKPIAAGTLITVDGKVVGVASGQSKSSEIATPSPRQQGWDDHANGELYAADMFDSSNERSEYRDGWYERSGGHSRPIS